jgi:NADPH:quinone reductase-like Zn-dependent oxidoreductase
MKAAVRERYGGPDLLELREVERPVLPDDGILVRVHACAVNPFDYHTGLHGRPYIARIGAGVVRPKSSGLGFDFAGTVEAAGRDVVRLAVGDKVYGFGTATFAQYAVAGEESRPRRGLFRR